MFSKVNFGSHRLIVTKMAKRRFSYSNDMILSLLTVFFDTSPHRLVLIFFFTAYDRDVEEGIVTEESK